ncbi:hypothetical protein FQA39_LY11767 [Lamprigera yunnana]|nr:hypothetical protein FQA39_LY11767 [Lamprigera yunnana]
MEPNYLKLKEITFKIACGDIKPLSTNQDARRIQLRALLKRKKLSKPIALTQPYNWNKYISEITESIKDLKCSLNEKDTQSAHIQSRLMHRLVLFNPSVENANITCLKEDLYAQFLVLEGLLDETMELRELSSAPLMDSIPTSCVQLAKEQIIKYSDPKYNINDLKTGDCETLLLNQTIYYLNKSKSKWISVGLYYPFEFASVVKIFGRSKQYVIFKEEEWIQFHEQRENINKYFQTFDTMWKPRQIDSKTLTFEMIEEKKILKIEDMSGNEVYLGWESVSEVWSLESVLRYRLSYSSSSNFKYFYEDVIRAVAEMSGDVKINIYNIINRLSEKSDDVCCMLEVLLFMPEKALFDVQLERRIQEQVERLYEELGALEFDADHEAIYGMERYYTVQQCEELRDKYKIGRKVCRKFLQGKTCSQCLVKRISEIGLRHFLDTVNKYIKDCSDSSSSSDEEVFKAVEQNGKETTEEEEE